MSDTQADDITVRLNAAAELMRRILQQSYERMHLAPGQRVLDVGCGAGADTLAMARVIGASGIVHGVDYDAAMILQATLGARTENAAAWVIYRHANATALPWPDDYFNATRSDRVFQTLLDPERAFDELLRVTQPDGYVLVISGDWDSLSIDSDGSDLESRRDYFAATRATNNPLSAQCLSRLFAQHGMLDVQIDLRPRFCMADSAAACWQLSIAPEAASSGLFASANVVMISGRKPPISAA